MDKTITRSTVNSQEYNAPEFPKSGFNLSYRDYNDYMLGRWHTSGFQWVMPSDKFSGHNKGNFTFNRIVTPMVAPVHVGQYNVYCTLRSIDNTFQENVAPSKHNGFSSSWSMPTTNTRDLFKLLVSSYGLSTVNIVDEDRQLEASLIDVLDDIILTADINPTDTLRAALLDNNIQGGVVTVTDIVGALTADIYQALSNNTGLASNYSLYKQAERMYCVDALKDVLAFWESRFGVNFANIGPTTTVQQFLYNFFDCLLTPFLGRYSYYADFGYNYVRPSDIYRISNLDIHNVVEPSETADLFDDTPMNEYPIRAMYAFWYDRCRDINLQPVSSTLPKPRQFGSVSIFDSSAGGLMYLLYRIRRWTENMFISAQPDSPARHVFAPVYQSSVAVTQNSENAFGTNTQEKLSSTEISYLDPLTGSEATVTCPIPTVVNDALSHLAQDSVTLEYIMPLQALRQAQQLERYLKRLDYFGDEYNDYMLSQYNSRVSDLRINHPEILSQSIDDADYEQEIANMSNGISNAGDRTATGTLSCSGDGYTSFAEEFGIVINVITFMPDDSYDGATPQLLMQKLVDMPLPIFAANNDELGRIMEIAANGMSPDMNGDDADFRFMFGHYPAYHGWRSRVDRVRGCFLNEMQDCLFRRYYGLDSAGTTPRLNYEFINCRPNLQMFANTVRYDCQLYGDVIHEFYVERVLPTPVETI